MVDISIMSSTITLLLEMCLIELTVY